MPFSRGIIQRLPPDHLPGGETLRETVPARMQAAPQGAQAGLVRIVGCGFDGLGSVLQAGKVGAVEVPFSGTIIAWTLLALPSELGSVQIDVWKRPYSVYPVTVADSITNGFPPTLTLAQKNRAEPPPWSTLVVTEGDVFGFHLDSATTLTWCVLEIEVQES